MPKLNQIIAIEKGIKTKNYEAFTALHKMSAKRDLFGGISRKYLPKGDDPTTVEGETLPDESKKVQEKCVANIKKATALLSELFDINAAREYGNCSAKADIVVEEQVILKDVPVTYLLYLEKQMNDLYTFFKEIPTLDSGENWTYDKSQDLWASDTSYTVRTKKVMKPVVLYPATDKHPAQVKEATEDMLVGKWSNTKYSGALSVAQQNDYLAKIEKLQIAVKFAREQANECPVQKQEVAKAIFSYLLG